VAKIRGKKVDSFLIDEIRLEAPSEIDEVLPKAEKPKGDPPDVVRERLSKLRPLIVGKARELFGPLARSFSCVGRHSRTREEKALSVLWIADHEDDGWFVPARAKGHDAEALWDALQRWRRDEGTDRAAVLLGREDAVAELEIFLDWMEERSGVVGFASGPMASCPADSLRPPPKERNR
jgi:hypothetical protein